jgi:endonuclease YncB( thermonuclease family)
MAGIGGLIGSMVPLGAAASTSPGQSSHFTFCHTGGGFNCVVDGDTAWIGGSKVRIADIDAPETPPSRCAEEATLGNRATQRLGELLNAGPFKMRSIDRDEDRFGRKLPILMRDVLVNEGVARWYKGGRQPWC